MDETLATLRLCGQQPVLRFERRLPHPPEKVWKALTDPAELAHWFPATIETELRVGAPMRFTFEAPEITPLPGEVVECDPPKVFAYRWGHSMLRWELVPDGSGCRLLFTHTLDGTEGWADRLSAPRHAAGWDTCLDRLDARLAGRSDPATGSWFARYERYAEQFGVTGGEVGAGPDEYLLRFERELVQPVAAAWSLLTGDGAGPENADPAGAAAGTPPPWSTSSAVPAGPVTTAEPPRVLEYSWRHDGTPAGRVRWELTDQQFGSRVVLTQTVPSRLAELRAPVLAAWQVHLELFVARLHGLDRPWPQDRVADLTKRYTDQLPA